MSILTAAAALATTQEDALPLSGFSLTPATQARVSINPDTVQDYAEILKEAHATGQPWPFPPIQVIRHTHAGANFNYVADGFHRLHAADSANWPHPIPAHITPGTIRDATLAAVAANATHGLRRTNADKRRAVTMLLQDPEWAQWSDTEIARRTHVSQPTVGRIRRDLLAQGQLQPITRRKGADGRTIDTSQIGNTRPDSSQNGNKTDPDPHPHPPRNTQHATRNTPPAPTEDRDPARIAMRLRHVLTHVAARFHDIDEDEWLETTGDTRLSDLRYLIKSMLSDLANH
jgi:hypothetical protein